MRRLSEWSPKLARLPLPKLLAMSAAAKNAGKGKNLRNFPQNRALPRMKERGWVGCILDSFGRVGLVSWRVVHFVLRGVLPPDTPMECSKVGSPIIAIGLTRSESLQTFQFKSSSPIYLSWGWGLEEGLGVGWVPSKT